jgi:nitrite reductase/ring-hydroxylating ferredoxin subunit
MPRPADAVLVLADARRLREGGGVRFTLVLDGISRPAFAVRWKGRVHAYVNRCCHQSLELDFGDAHYFDDPYDALVCCHHGARYTPDTGACVDGPCAGGRLTALEVAEEDGGIWCLGRTP